MQAVEGAQGLRYLVYHFKKFNSGVGYCLVVNIRQIAKNNFSLEISQYIAVLPAEKKEEQININDALQ